MSHFVRIRTQIREQEHLVQALRDLHYQFQEGQNLVVNGFLGNKETAEVVVNTGSKYDIGFRVKPRSSRSSPIGGASRLRPGFAKMHSLARSASAIPITSSMRKRASSTWWSRRSRRWRMATS